MKVLQQEKSLLALQCENNLSEWGPLREQVQDFLEQELLDLEKIETFLLCAEEVFTNIIIHALKGVQEQHLIAIKIWTDDSLIHIEFIDDGIVFDAFPEIVKKQKQVSLEAPPGGLGLWLIKQSAHQFRYERKASQNRFYFNLLRKAK